MEIPLAARLSPGTFTPALTLGRWVKTIIVLTVIAAVALVMCLQYGTERIAFWEVIRILLGAAPQTPAGESAVSSEVILLDVRLPRLLLAFLVGASLAAIGVALQALLRNPLADPFVLGISSGAALGAALALQFGVTWSLGGFSAIHLCAFLAAALTMAVMYRIAVADGRIPVQTLLLAGVIMNAVLSALILFITSLSDSTSAFRLFFWLMGSLAILGYASLGAIALYVLIGLAALFALARPLNVLSLGEEPAHGLGLRVEFVKRMIFFTSALLTGAVVAVSGLIGFVGMIVPHAVRMVLGPDHRLVLPSSALVGGSFLAVADTAARSLLAPSELPVGVITALCGGPFFIYLLITQRRKSMS